MVRPKNIKKRRRYGSYFWVDPKSGLGYAKVQVPTHERTASGRIKYKTVMRRADTVTAADQIAREIIDEHADRGQAYLDGRSMTFAQLVEWYKENFVFEPIYSDGKKVAGMRSWQNERNKLDRLSVIFGKLLIDDVDDAVLRRHKLKRLRAGIKPATVNREFETIRAMFRRAVRRKWLKANVEFYDLIDKTLEDRRTVTITDDQERLILSSARSITHSPRIYALIIALRDTGARPNELYPVNDFTTDYSNDKKTYFEPIRWRDIFGTDGEIHDVTRLVSYKGKVREERLCVVTERMKVAFRDLWNYLADPSRAKRLIEAHQARLDNLVFPETSYKKAWQIVRRETGLIDLRLRDLRRDWSTRLARLGFSDRLAQRALGHRTLQMTFKYTEFDMQAAMMAKGLLDDSNQSEIFEIADTQ